KRVAEQATLDLQERKHANDTVAVLGIQVVAPMSEHLLENITEHGQMKYGCTGCSAHEVIPARGVTRVEDLNREACGRRSGRSGSRKRCAHWRSVTRSAASSSPGTCESEAQRTTAARARRSRLAS